MAESLVESYDQSHDQTKVLVRHTYTIEDHDEELMALTSRIAWPTHFVPPTSVLKPGVNHDASAVTDVPGLGACGGQGPISGD